MRNTFFIVIILSLLITSSCNDGDVITVELDFDDTFLACDGVSGMVFYKTKDDPSESLSMLISSLNLEQILGFKGTDTIITKTGAFNYRTYSNASLPSNLFCNDIPSSEIKITSDSESTSDAVITASLTEDDKDGISAELEDINGNGDLTDDDTDGDDIPNYLDVDDDGDNVLTKDENPDPNEDGILDDAQDTDNDGIPDYLDDDDDGDEVLTRDEENITTQDLNPRNDVTNSDVGPDYLNPEVSEPLAATAYRVHTIYKTYTVTLVIKNISLPNLYQEELNFGTLNDSALEKTETKTPEFN